MVGGAEAEGEGGRVGCLLFAVVVRCKREYACIAMATPATVLVCHKDRSNTGRNPGTGTGKKTKWK